MSDIRANLIRNSSGNGPINLSWPRASDGKIIGQSASKGYGMINSDAVVLNSFNLSSITDDGNGSYAGVLIVPMNQASFVASTRSNSSANFVGINRVSGQPSQWVAMTRALNGNNTPQAFCYTVHGDLA